MDGQAAVDGQAVVAGQVVVVAVDGMVCILMIKFNKKPNLRLVF